MASWGEFEAGLNEPYKGWQMWSRWMVVVGLGKFPPLCGLLFHIGESALAQLLP